MPKTGATRYQKFLKSEKAKTKLKNKKELPKGTNVTKTNFKVKKIVIKEQLSKHNEKEALSTRKLNMKELLSRLGHFNTKTRIDALGGLKEIITMFPNSLEQNLGQFINVNSPLALNIEKVVRHKSLEVLHAVLSNTPKDKVTPFFNILSTYLRSAMTHIDSKIQEDSLLFLDVLLNCHPEILVQEFHKIMPNFLDMISKLRMNNTAARTLTTNLNSRITSVKWRIKVFHRLHDFLLKFVEYNYIYKRDEDMAKTANVFDHTKFNHYPIFNTSYISVCNLSWLSSNSLQNKSLFNEEENFLTYIDTLMPLLFETWLEISPNAKNVKNIETIVSEDGAVLLKYIIKIVLLLWNLLDYLKKKNSSSEAKKVFRQKYHQLFSQHFVEMFPYITNIKSRSSNESSSEEIVTDPKLVVENLEICHLFIILSLYIPLKSHNKEVALIITYIEKTIDQSSNDNNVNKIIINILDTLFSSKTTSWTKSLHFMDSLFSKIVSTYFNEDTPTAFTDELFSLLCKIALNDKLSYIHKTNVFEKWLLSLPNILLKETISIQTIETIHKFALRNNRTFNEVIRPHLFSIIENLPKITVPNSIIDINSYYKLFSLLYWIKCWDEKSLNLLEKQLLDNSYKNDYSKFIFETLRSRSGGII